LVHVVVCLLMLVRHLVQRVRLDLVVLLSYRQIRRCLLCVSHVCCAEVLAVMIQTYVFTVAVLSLVVTDRCKHNSVKWLIRESWWEDCSSVQHNMQIGMSCSHLKV